MDSRSETLDSRSRNVLFGKRDRSSASGDSTRSTRDFSLREKKEKEEKKKYIYIYIHTYTYAHIRMSLCFRIAVLPVQPATDALAIQQDPSSGV